MGGIKWKPKERDYVIERKHFGSKLRPAKFHPLLDKAVLQSKKKKKAALETKQSKGGSPTKKIVKPEAVFDPLRMMAAAAPSQPVSAGLDPLSMLSSGSSSSSVSTAATSSSNNSSIGNREGKQHSISKSEDDPFQSWQDKQPRILETYSTSSRVAVTANFLEEKEQKGVRAVDQTRSRLEEIEAAAGANEEQKNYLSQKEYIAHMEEQHSRLKKAWEIGQRVVSLKIAIQCAKLLGDTSVPKFYPSMYVLLGNILDTFGDLVYQRLYEKALDPASGSQLPRDFTSQHVSKDAQMTCNNWFYKTACIRELMPRLYIDLALIKSYRFVRDDGYAPILERLSQTLRGIGDPLVAMYARCYLANKARQCFELNAIPNALTQPMAEPYKRPLLEAYDDFMFSMKSLAKQKFQTVKHVKEGRVTVDEYLYLFSPALEWLCQNIGFGAQQDLFFALLEQFKTFFPYSVVLVHLLGSFDANFVSANALTLVNLIKNSKESKTISKSKQYLALGKALVKTAPPEKQKLPILNDVWKVVTKIQDPLEYLEIADVFVQFLIKNFTDREVNIFLKDVIKHVRKASQEEIQSPSFQRYLSNIVEKQIEYTHDLFKTLAMDNFLSMMDLLENSSKLPVAKLILTQFVNSNYTTADPVIIHTLMDVAKSLHDSIDAQTFEDEKKQIASTIIGMIRCIDFQRDLEQQLNFYVDCRQAYTRLDMVLTELINKVKLLCARALQMMRNKHTKKTSAFVKACLAYCHITIPSLERVFLRLRLFLSCGEMALQNGMIVQAEAFLKAGIGLIGEVPATVEEFHVVRSTEKELESYLLSFAAFLLLVPGHPVKGPFYLVQGLINAVNNYPVWNTQGKPHTAKTRVLMGVLQLLTAYYQRNFLYSSVRVQSNDALYGGAQDTYLKPLLELTDFLVGSTLEQIHAIGGDDIVARRSQGLLALQMVNLLVSFFDMNKATATMVVKLVGLAKGHGKAVDPNYYSNTIAHIKNKRGTWYEDVMGEINKL